jgi:uncharacterized protein
MAVAIMLDFATAQADLTTHGIIAHASEIQGVLVGLICGGQAFESTDYLTIINDLFNNGEGLPNQVKSRVKTLVSEVWQQLSDESFGFQLLLPDDDESLPERSQAISVWVQGFNLGFGLQQKNTPRLEHSSLSADVQEVLKDFAEIANLSTDIDEDESSEQAFFEVMEYVRLSALMCFSELGQLPESNQQNKQIH